MLIGFVYDLKDDYIAQGYSPEDAAEFDSIETIDAISSTLEGLGHTVERVGGIQKLAPALASGRRWDLVFNIAEGAQGVGREAQVPCLLEAYGQPYTFSASDVMVTTMDKSLAKMIVRQAGVPTPDFKVVREEADIAGITMAFPMFVKPFAEGTSKGVTEQSKVNNPGELRAQCLHVLKRFSQPALVETFLPGREFTVGILGGGDTARVIGVLEITIKEGGDASCYSYRNKMDWFEIMTLCRDDVARAAGDTALRAWRAIGALDAGRVDIRLAADGTPSFIECNPLAGLRPNYSELPELAAQAGMTYPQLLESIVAEASARYGLTSAPAKKRA